MNAGFMSTAQAEQVLQDEKAAMRDQVQHEFYDKRNPNEAIDRELQNDNPEVSHVYGGAMASGPQEGSIVQAWRPTPWGEWQLAKGIIHRVHDDRTVTIQFVPDQHRVRTPVSNVKPLYDITPEYPEVRLAPGERLPTRAEILAREQHANEWRDAMGLGPDAPLPGTDHNLRAGESERKDGSVVIRTDRWGIPAPTLDALRNRSIPPGQVTGEYGRHFYSSLYRNNFYLGQEKLISAAGRIGVEGHGRADPNTRVVSHRYIDLDGRELEQDLKTGKWYPVVDETETQREPPESFLEKLVWFLG